MDELVIDDEEAADVEVDDTEGCGEYMQCRKVRSGTEQQQCAIDVS